MFVELHFIQNFAPSNLNRDDTNTPKDCEFGGVRRARISSQCLKRAIRLHPLFSQYSGVAASERTRMLVKELTERLIASGKAKQEAQDHAKEFARYYSSKKGKLDGSKTSIMLFLSLTELNVIQKELLKPQNWGNIKGIKTLAESFAKGTKNRSGAPDIAMFGRMLAARPETNVDAACQVAHAISTHRVSMDIDFFTAVDDLGQSESGAGIMGVTSFNSACFYRYACVDFEQLLENLGGDISLARKTLEGFIRASVNAVPSGKQNSFAAQNLPSFLMAATRTDGICWSLANAFENPIMPKKDQGLVIASIGALDTYWGEMKRLYGGEIYPVVAMLGRDAELVALKNSRVDTVESWVKAVMTKIPQE